MIGAAANIGTQGDHDTVMRSPWLAFSVPFQRQLVSLHDPFGMIFGFPLAFCCRLSKEVIRR